MFGVGGPQGGGVSQGKGCTKGTGRGAEFAAQVWPEGRTQEAAAPRVNKETLQPGGLDGRSSAHPETSFYAPLGQALNTNEP